MKITRNILLLLALVYMFGCTAQKHSTTINVLNGTWIPVSETIGSTSLPAAAFATQKLVINDSNYTFTAESVDKGVVQTAGNKMDIYGREGVNTGKHFMALYKYEQEQLTICYNLKGDSYPESFETNGKPTLFLCVFKKM